MPPRRKEPTKSPKGKQATKPVPQPLPNGKRAALEEELDSGASSGDEDAPEDEEPEEPSETADERRVRLAKDLLAGMDAAVESSTRESRIRDGDDAVADQLEEEALRASGKWHSQLAASLAGCAIEPDGVRVLRGPQLSATCVALAPDESASYCGAKGGSLWRWDLATGVRSQLKTPTSNGGSNRDVLAVACSPDGRLLASAGRSAAVVIWDCRTLAKVMELPGHRDAVTSLAVSRSSTAGDVNPELFSASADRCVKVWNFQRRATQIETLFGHQEGITALDAVQPDVVLSAAADRTVRLWKVADESQLVYRGHTAPIDCVAQLAANAFVSGSQDGSLAFWSVMRKKPIATVEGAHGNASWGGACWMTALTTVPFSDVAISGSCDGALRFWHCNEASRSLQQVLSAPVKGFVNGLVVAPSGRFVVAAVGQEHRLGRWARVRDAKNGCAVISLPAELHRKS